MSRVPPYSRHVRAVPTLSPTGLSPAPAARSSGLRLASALFTAWEACRPPSDPVQPRWRNGGTLGTPAVWACTVSLAATPAPSYFLRVREMFQFPGLPPTGLCVHPGVTGLVTLRGSPIRRPSAQRLRAAPRGISLLRHVLHRHERPRHPPDALDHGYTTVRDAVAPVALGPCPGPLCTLALLHTRFPACACFALVLAPSLLRSTAAVPDCCLIRIRQQTATYIEKSGGGDEETRTPDPLRAKEVLSQLSYIPEWETGGRLWIRTTDLTLIRGVL